MPEDVKLSNEEAEAKEKAQELEEFLSIKDMDGNLIYKSSKEELTDVLTSILTTGKFVKTFNPFKGIVELTYESITNEKRTKAYELVKEYADNHKDTSRLILDSYTSKVNAALQLVRIQIGKSEPINLSQVDLIERIKFLTEMPEETVNLVSKYLMVFANITSRAFNSEEILKN